MAEDVFYLNRLLKLKSSRQPRYYGHAHPNYVLATFSNLGPRSRSGSDGMVAVSIDNRAAFSIETFANVLQNFLSLVHDCCGTFANCFDTERSPDLCFYEVTILVLTIDTLLCRNMCMQWSMHWQ